MKVVIQCSGAKNGKAWSVSDFNDTEVIFVAHPDQYDKPDSAHPYKPDDLIPNTSMSWRDYLVCYNNRGDNPDELLRAGELYKPKIYLRLVERFGWQNTYILSAGWGLIRSDFLLPYYDITFASQAEPYKHRRKNDHYNDFNHLLLDDSSEKDETILFLGGKDYLPLYYSLTRDLKSRKVIYFKAKTIPKENGYQYVFYKSNQVQNWHYNCAEDLLESRLGQESSLCEEIHQLFNQLERFEFPFDKSRIPLNGIYILFEKGETGHGIDRIVRVGTHIGDNQLPSRLTQHFIKENKDRSIFRKNIGRAVLNKRSDPFLDQWNLDLTTRKARETYQDIVDHDKQKEIEREVALNIQSNFSFVVIPVENKDQRLRLESRLISSVSLCNECFPSDTWLGVYSPTEKIRRSGLWQVNQLYKKPLSENDLDELKSLLGQLDKRLRPLPKRIGSLLQSTSTDSPLFPPTILFNEGWLLRLIIDWFSKHSIQNHPLSFPPNGKWFSEAYLPSAFAPRYRGDPLGESSTHADGVIGHFIIGESGKADLSLFPGATHFVVLEAKMFSKLSSRVTNARYFDQAARNVACIAETLRRANRNPTDVNLGFYLLAPKSQIEQGVFKEMARDSIRQKVEHRVGEYKGEKKEWYSDWFRPTFDLIDVQSLRWEAVISEIWKQDFDSGDEISEFYQRCIEFNQLQTKG